jgi:type II secretory pathway pseudopilin PulG
VGTKFTGGWREALGVLAAGTLLAAAITFPFVTQLDRVSRSENSDGQWSIWSVAWVARTLVTDPANLFNANIFYPHRQTLAFSENNLAAGVLAVPIYWASKNPYLTLNVVFLLSMAVSFAGAYYLVRHLTGDRRAAVVSGICFAFCPYVFARTSHIQLLMTGGLPFALLAFHRLLAVPSWRRGVVLGLVIAAQATVSGYYAILTALMIGGAVLTVALTRGMWRNARFWGAVAIAAAVTLVFLMPLAAPYFRLQRESGFARPLAEAALYSADWRAYLASSAWAHRWMLEPLGRWKEVLFPGFVATVLGVTGLVIGWRRGGRGRDTAVVYGVLTALAVWVSLGPSGGLYSWLYRAVPVFEWLRAPARFGVLVALGLSVLAGLALSNLVPRTRRGTLAAAVIALAAAAELATPLRFREVQPFAPAYRVLATLPPGPVIELPFLSKDNELHGHAKYMLRSTTHWMPLINGYSDYIPPEFQERAQSLRGFPSRAAFRALKASPPRYAVFHPAWYRDPALLRRRIQAFSTCLRPIYTTGPAELYEVLECSDAVMAGDDD